MAPMLDETTFIADKVRGVASEKRANQEAVGDILKLSRQAVNLRFNARTPFTATEILTLARTFNVDITRFFPSVEEMANADASERVA